MHKIIFLSIFLFLSDSFLFSQTNTFPASGNVGIGTGTADLLDKLVINSGNISFTTSGNYGLKWTGGSTLYEQTTPSGSVMQRH